MRKNNLFLLLLMALIVMSCSKDETTMSIPQESNAIEFGTYVGRDAQTRASVTDLSALQAENVGFGVLAHYTGASDYTTPTTIINFMYNQQVKYASSKWSYTPVKYWPNNPGDKVSFFAYAPYAPDEHVSISIPSGLVEKPTVVFSVEDNVENHTDLVWGVNESTGFPFLNQTKQSVNGNIKFTFKHALARIGFNVEAMVDLVNDVTTGGADNDSDNGAIAGETQIVVTKVELIGNFYDNAQLNLKNEAANVPLWGDFLYKQDENLRTFVLSSTGENFVSTSTVGTLGNTTSGQVATTTKAPLNKGDSYLMVIPQKFESGSEVKIRVTYDVITADGNLNTGQSKITNVITSDEFTFNFEHGKAYTFNLHLGMTSVKFDASVTPWDETTPGTVVNVPINLIEQPEPESNSYVVAPNSTAIRIPVSRVNASDLLDQPQLSDGDIFTAELVWTDNENRVAANSNIKSIAVDGTGPTGFLVIEPGSASGNAVVAIKKDDKILWSWHIWVTEETPVVKGEKGFMDRNLGVIGNIPGEVGTKGLLYQWGRKDPFPGSSTIDGKVEPTLYTSSGTTTIAKTEVVVASNFANSVANPATYYFNGNSPYDWYTKGGTQNGNLWGGGATDVKTIYDPCPEGWRVPKDGAWSGLTTENFTWNGTDKGRTADTHGGFYPAAGYRIYIKGPFNHVGSDGFYWSASPYTHQAYGLYFGNYITPSSNKLRTLGLSVRCVQE